MTDMGKLAWSDPELTAKAKNLIPQGKFAGNLKHQKTEIAKLKFCEKSPQEKRQCFIE